MADTTMSETMTVEIGADLSKLTDKLGEAARGVNAFAAGTVASATRAMAVSFDGTFNGLARAVAAATRGSSLSVREMVNSIIADIARLAIKRGIVQPLENLLNSAMSAVLSSVGGRAIGGPVMPGAAYVVGEKGPELFVPSGAGEIVPGARAVRGAPQIVFNVRAQDAKSFLKSESQIAAMLTRALARGQRNL
jgi:phage-related minor tail protein